MFPEIGNKISRDPIPVNRQDNQVSPSQPSFPSPSQKAPRRQLLTIPSSQQSLNFSSTEQIAPSSPSREQPINSRLRNVEEMMTIVMLQQCADCGRKFNESSHKKHVKICKKVFIEKRKAFDSQKQRLKGTEMAVSATTTPTIQSAKHSSHRSNSALPKWKADSQAFRQAVKQARQVSASEKKSKETGIPLAQLSSK
jgi:hypothetical protein